MTKLEKIINERPCYACVHYNSCSVRTGAYILCKDKSHENFEYNTQRSEEEE